jgi:hypothetical protein
MSIGRVYMPKGSELDKQSFSRTPGEFIEFNALNGGMQHIQPGQAISTEYYNTLKEDEQAMWDLAGVSKSSGTGTIPAGMSGASGKAMREYNETAATRLKARSDGLDNWFERLCTVALHLAVAHFKAGGKGAKVLAAGSRVLEEVDFDQLDIKEGEGIEIRCVSVSGLPAHPAARLEYVSQLVKDGFVDRKYGVKLLSIPNIEQFEDINTAAIDIATAHIEGTLFDGKQYTPEPNQEYLEILLDLGTRELLRAQLLIADTDEESEEKERNLELMRRLLESGANQLKLMAPPPAAPPAVEATGPV